MPENEGSTLRGSRDNVDASVFERADEIHSEKAGGERTVLRLRNELREAEAEIRKAVENWNSTKSGEEKMKSLECN